MIERAGYGERIPPGAVMRRWRLWLTLLIGGVAASPLLFVGYIWLGFQLDLGSGSMNEAKRLRPLVEAVSDPDSLPAEDGWSAVKCANGEWILGVSRSSHGAYSQWTGGGTVVLKDSRGRVRCFLGHVCGRWTIELSPRRPFASLDEIDAVLADCRFTEHAWP